MVGSRLALDLLDTGVRVVACGDPGQLPPVADHQYFTDPDLTLRTIHRQALESPIVRQAHRVRSTGTYVADGDDFQVLGGATDEHHRAADVALCWRNATRRALNARRRRVLRDLDGTTLRAGEPLMALQNDYRIGLVNGEVYVALADRAPGGDLLLRAEDGRELSVLNPRIEDLDGDFDERRDDDEVKPFALAYAATVHKFQGSEADTVLLVDEHREGDGRREFLYTGFTRAAKRIFVVAPRYGR